MPASAKTHHSTRGAIKSLQTEGRRAGRGVGHHRGAKLMSSERHDLPTGGHQDRLESWKEVAAHFQKGVTTVQRWEREEGLPVHRHAHARKGSIFAYRHELDAWRLGRSESSLAADDPDTADVDGTKSLLPAAEARLGGEQMPTPLPDAPEEHVTGERSPFVPSGRRRLYAMATVLGGLAVWLASASLATFDAPAANAAPAENGLVTAPSVDEPLLTRVPLQMATATFSQSILGGVLTEPGDRSLLQPFEWVDHRARCGRQVGQHAS